MTTSVDDILNGPDYFFCEHYKARMRKQICIDRQAHREDIRARQNPNTALAADLETVGCSNCAQGAQIREEIDMGQKRTPEQRERISAGIRAAIAKKKAAGGGAE